MKKNYIKPEMSSMPLCAEQPLAISGVKGNIGNSPSIGYGGVDSEGTMEAEVKEDAFDFSWE